MTSEETEPALQMEKSPDEPPKDQIVAVIGETGRWQLEKILIVFLISIPGLAHIFVSAFVAPKRDFWCADDLPSDLVDIDVPENIKNNCSISCSKYSYDESFWEETIVSEWDLVCSSSGLPVVSKMVFFSGFAVGTFVAGLVSDIWGRKRSILLFSFLMMASGLATSFMPVFPSFIIMWWLVGVAAVANFTVAFVWTIELAAGKWKVILGMAMQFTWPFGRGLAVVIAWIFPNWRTIFQVVSAPCILAPIMIYFLPESPRWLIAKGRLSEARSILASGAKRNKKDISEEEIDIKQPKSSTQRKGTIADIMKYPKLRIKTLIMYFNWFSSSFMLYGIALNWQGLTGGLFMNFLIAAVLDFPAKLLALVSLVWFGRRLPYISLTFIAGLCFVACLVIPRGVYPNELPIVVLSLVSSFCVSASFAMLWMWTSELMPTTVRNAGVGSCSFVARIGGILATTLGILAEISPLIPTAMFASSALISASISLFLPETHGAPLPDSPEESEKVPMLQLNQVFKFKINRKEEAKK